MMESLAKLKDTVSRSVSPENFTGEKGKGGMAIHGTGENCARDLGQGWKISPSIELKPGETFTLADIHGQGMIRHIWIVDSCDRNRKLILRMYWDGAEIPSVEAPMCDFFAAAEYQNYWQLTSTLVCVNPKRAFNCYFEMPFYSEAKLTLENRNDSPVTVYYQIDYQLEPLPEGMGYFHAQYRQVTPLAFKEIYTILDKVEGKGQYIGTYMLWTVHSNGWWGEGEIKYYMDGDTDFPTICGTGTEDYFCGSFAFDINGQYRDYSTPDVGLRIIRPDGAYNACTRFSMYRWHTNDPIYFAQDLRVTIQALGWQDGHRYLPLRDDICSVAYFYLDRICQTPPTLPTDDELRF